MPSLEYIGCKLAMSAVKPVMSKVGSLFEKEADHIWKVDDKFMKLQVTYVLTQSLLSKLDSCSINETSLEPLLNDLDRYCYDIEDIVDDLDLSFATKEDDQNPVRSYIIKSLRLTIPHQIGELQEKLQGLNSLIDQLLSAGAINPVQSQNGGRALYSKSLYDKTPLVPGTRRDQDKQMVISQLISQQSEHCGVSIIGMDGLGKTSLARTILLDQSTKEHFPIVLSACVSGKFEMDDVVQKLVHGYSTRTEQQILEQIVSSTKSLIILDDIESVTDEEWDRFISNNLSSSPGWKILTTTRNPEVAEVTKSNPFYLERMTDEDCKKLILDRVKLSKFDCESWSDDIEVIAKKCMGIPLLANKVGLKLSKKKMGVERKEYIMQLKMEKLWDLQEFREVFPSLNLNEPKLPPDLKRCFSYCSLFPTGHEFNKDELIQLWEVEGMNHCFKDLLSRSILQPFKSRDKKQTVYKMHEFNHEFAHLLASKAICRLEETNLLSSARSLRHLSLTCHNTDETLLKKIEECEGLRTFLLLHQSKPKTRVISYNFFQKLHRLRLLDLSHTNISNLPKPKFPSKHLRFLDLSYSSITKLPESVCSIRALRILKLKGCSELLQLPKNLHHLTNLTHLHVDMKDLVCLPSKIGKLTKLEVLDSFSVSVDDSCRPVELQGMKHLKEIHMFGLENIENKQEAQETMLSEKLLKILVLEWTSDSVGNASDVLEGLKPHSHLKDLAVMNYSGENFPEWLVSKSCKIVNFKLEDCPNCEELPSLSQLPYLTNLVFRSIHNVKTLDDQFCGGGEGGYYCLELLEFRDMRRLVRWTGLKFGYMSRLSSLKIIDCPMLINLPSFEPLGSLIYLEINNCPELLSLPVLPPSMKSVSGALLMIYSALVELRCQHEGADWPKIKDIPYVEIDATRVITKSRTPSQENIKDNLSMYEHHPSMLATKSVTQGEVTKDPRFIFFLLPEDYDIEEDVLIQLWMAAEYINDEQVGEDYVKSFINTGYLSDRGISFMTGKGRYRINSEKINELRLSGNDESSCYLQWKKESHNVDPESIRHVSLGCSAEIDATTFKTLEKFTQLRTLLFLGNHGHRLIRMPSHTFSCLCKLQTLDLSRTLLKEVPSSIRYMIDLRYLDLSWTLIEWLPDVLCSSLAELQTLRLRGCSNLRVLPELLNLLTKLRHLDFDVLGQLAVMPKRIGALVHLRTLSAFLVGIEEGCKISEFAELSNLSGELCIAKLENVEYESGASEAQAYLRGKLLLKKLELRWTASDICGEHQDSYHILEQLEPPRILEELRIMCYEDSRFPPWMGDPKFDNLTRIKLYMCENLFQLPQIELLPSLVHLELVGLNKVQSIELQSEDDAFPKLEKLEINEMQILRVWKWQNGKWSDFRSLTHLIINDCPEFDEFDVLSHLSSIKYFEIRECPKLQSLSDRELPDTLEELIVDECPQIQKRCVEDEGEDWYKIEHVTKKSIRNNDEYDG